MKDPIELQIELIAFGYSAEKSEQMAAFLIQEKRKFDRELSRPLPLQAELEKPIVPRWRFY